MWFIKLWWRTGKTGEGESESEVEVRTELLEERKGEWRRLRLWVRQRKSECCVAV